MEIILRHGVGDLDSDWSAAGLRPASYGRLIFAGRFNHFRASYNQVAPCGKQSRISYLYAYDTTECFDRHCETLVLAATFSPSTDTFPSQTSGGDAIVLRQAFLQIRYQLWRHGRPSSRRSVSRRCIMLALAVGPRRKLLSPLSAETRWSLPFRSHLASASLRGIRLACHRITPFRFPSLASCRRWTGWPRRSLGVVVVLRNSCAGRMDKGSILSPQNALQRSHTIEAQEGEWNSSLDDRTITSAWSLSRPTNKAPIQPLERSASRRCFANVRMLGCGWVGGHAGPVSSDETSIWPHVYSCSARCNTCRWSWTRFETPCLSPNTFECPSVPPRIIRCHVALEPSCHLAQRASESYIVTDGPALSLIQIDSLRDLLAPPTPHQTCHILEIDVH